MTINQVNQNSGNVNNSVGLTSSELAVMNMTRSLWNEFVTLPGNGPDEVNDVRQAIHTIQRIMACRVAVRANPEVWEPME